MPLPSLQPALVPAIRSSLRAALAVLLLVLSLSQVAQAVSLSTDEQEIANFLTGDKGQRRDRSRMRLDPILTSVAQARAQDMAARRYFSHTNPDGLGPNALVRAAGYALPSFWSGSRSGNFIESIGAGYATPAAAWDGWMNSASHRTHLLASSSFYRDQVNFGVGSYSDPSSPFRRYWVIITAPPSSRGEATFVSRRSVKTPRIAGLEPVFAGPDEDRLIDWETAPRPSVSTPPTEAVPPAGAAPRAGEKLWNSEGPTAPTRPRAPRPRGEG